MAKPWQTIEKAETPDGVLELRKRSDRDFLILINNRVLMNSSANRSEIALGEQACRLVLRHWNGTYRSDRRFGPAVRFRRVFRTAQPLRDVPQCYPGNSLPDAMA